MFTINGVDYPSWDQVPEELRRQLAALPDADGNGIPDLIEGTAATLPDQVVRTQTYVETSSRSFVLNSPEDFAALPPRRARPAGRPSGCRNTSGRAASGRAGGAGETAGRAGRPGQRGAAGPHRCQAVVAEAGARRLRATRRHTNSRVDKMLTLVSA